MKTVTAKQMRDLDHQTIKSGVPGLVLMERAGEGAFQEILLFSENISSRHRKHFIILAGGGNNGGDGYVIARHIDKIPDYRVSVYSTCPMESLKGDAYHNAIRLPANVEFRVIDSLPEGDLTEGVIFIDCLLGTGITGNVKGPYATIINQVNSCQLPVISIDLPSGVNSDTGDFGNVGICADLTITVGLPKIGLFLKHGQKFSGQLRLIEIGLLPKLIEEIRCPFHSIFRQDIRDFLSRVPKSLHKGEAGRILIIGSSLQFPNASLLSGMGAVRAGGGLVTVAYPKSIAFVFNPQYNSLILSSLDDKERGYHIGQSKNVIAKLLDKIHVVAIGPGLSRNNDSKTLVKQILETNKTVVLDADAFEVFNDDISFFPRVSPTILTPHPGELTRLLKARNLKNLLNKDRILQAKTLAKDLQSYVVLKGSATVIASPSGEVFLNSSGSPGLATGGTGDVLTGIIAAFLSRSENVLSALQSAVFVHGFAAELASVGNRNLIADDLPSLVGQALKEISPFA